MPRDEFHVVSLERTPRPWDANTVLCLDANVVSSIVSLYKRGYNSSPSHVRVVNLFKKCGDNGVETYDQSLDLLEGSGFHLGGVVPYNAGLRYISLRAVIRATATGVALDGADGIPAEGLNAQVEANLRTELNQAISHLPWAFLPSYCLALRTHLAWKTGESQPSENLTEYLAHAPFVPPESAILCLASLEEDLSPLGLSAQRILKKGNPRPLQAAASAAWDVTDVLPDDTKAQYKSQIGFTIDPVEDHKNKCTRGPVQSRTGSHTPY